MEKLIEKADAIDESLYTTESVKIFKGAIERSKEVLINTKATYSEIGLAIIELKEAMDNLVPKDDTQVEADKTVLEMVIDYAEDVKSKGALKDVDPAVGKEFEEALENAKAVLADKSATEVQVDEASKRLVSVINMLEFKKGDKEQLEKLVTIIKALNESRYIPSTWSKLQVELEKANKVILDENAMEAEVKDAYNKLIKAYLDLRILPDKSKLEELINKAELIDTSKYTKESVDELNKKIKEAIKVLDNKEATQQEVDEALKGLELALGSLELAQGNNNNNSGNTDNDNTNNDSSDNNVNDNLPATGDSSTFALVVSAALLLGSGFVLKKRK